MGISRDYPLKTRTSKQPIGEVPGYEIIPSHPLKYPRSKQGLNVLPSVTPSRQPQDLMSFYNGLKKMSMI
jgi:hypothetical protein